MSSPIPKINVRFMARNLLCLLMVGLGLGYLGAKAQDGPGLPLQPAVSVRQVGEAREIPARMDFYTVVHSPYSRRIQSKSDEPTWSGLDADLAAAFVEWMRKVRGISLAYDPIFVRDAAEIKAAMLADPTQAVGVMVSEEGNEPVADSAWARSLPWLRSKMALLVPLKAGGNWGDWKSVLRSGEGSTWVVHRSPMSQAWMRAWSVQISAKSSMTDTDDFGTWWKTLGKSNGLVLGVADVGTMCDVLRQEGSYAWKIKVPDGQKNLNRFLVFPRQSLLAPYWEEFMTSGWGWTSSNEMKVLLDKYFDSAAQEHVRPLRP